MDVSKRETLLLHRLVFHPVDEMETLLKTSSCWTCLTIVRVYGLSSTSASSADPILFEGPDWEGVSRRVV